MTSMQSLSRIWNTRNAQKSLRQIPMADGISVAFPIALSRRPVLNRDPRSPSKSSFVLTKEVRNWILACL